MIKTPTFFLCLQKTGFAVREGVLKLRTCPQLLVLLVFLRLPSDSRHCLTSGRNRAGVGLFEPRRRQVNHRINEPKAYRYKVSAMNQPSEQKS